MTNFEEPYYTELKGFHHRIDEELTILLYHGVTNTISDGIENYAQKHVPVSVFIEQMKYIKNNCTLLSIDEVVSINQSNLHYPPRSVVVTFDDGFRNNYTVAAPVLHDFKIPAVFYISSGVVNTTQMFWVDVLEDCLNQTKKQRITMVLDEPHSFNVSSEPEKISALNKIKLFCKNNYARKDLVIENVLEATGVTPSTEHSPNYEKISWEELCRLNRDNLFTVGGHSLYHEILTGLDSDTMKINIKMSLKLLQYNLDKSVIHYSYPEGQRKDYNREIILFLKEQGIVCCPTARVGLNDPSIDLFNLRRIMVNFSGMGFPYTDNCFKTDYCLRSV